MPEQLSEKEAQKWCEGCPLDIDIYHEGCDAYLLRWPQWPRWQGEECPARQAAEARAEGQ